MVVDFHTHVFPDKIAKATISSLENAASNRACFDGTVGGLISHMKKSGVDISVNLPVLTKPSQFESVCRFGVSINEMFASSKVNKIISFAGIHPDCDNIPEKMKFLKDNGFLGVKIHPDYQNAFINHPGYIQILSCAKDLDMIVVTHAGVDDGYIGEPVKCPPELCLEVINKVGHSKFVLGHFGGHSQWDRVYNLLCGKDVYFDTAFTFHEIDKDLFVDIVNKHGEDKILFATDCPWRDQKDDLSIFSKINLSEGIKQKILYKNAFELLGIKG
ncbi:MAG: amidohydrolase family protein [Clostridia bacterium]|nr:amidohydrolase family protein [Clostridia bacterium]